MMPRHLPSTPLHFAFFRETNPETQVEPIEPRTTHYPKAVCSAVESTGVLMSQRSLKQGPTVQPMMNGQHLTNYSSSTSVRKGPGNQIVDA